MRATQRTMQGGKLYGDAITRMRIANQLNLFGHSTSLDIIGYNPQPPDVSKRLMVPPDATAIAPSETHFQSPMYDRAVGDEGETKVLKPTCRMTPSVPLRTWGGPATDSTPTWKDFQATRHRQIKGTLRRKTLRETGKSSLKPPRAGPSGARR